MSTTVELLYQDENLAAFYKPQGMHVHPHENPLHRVHRSQILLYQARDMLGEYLYPVHRLDAGTSGVVLFALNKAAARELAFKFQNHDLQKTYETVVRGYVPENGHIDLDLELDSTNQPVPAHTDFFRIATKEIDEKVGSRNPTARYSLVRVHPRSGRFHQIRRHFARKAHPVLGDAMHGDSKHNRFFREKLEIQGLCLWAKSFAVKVSWEKEPICVTSPISEKWKKIYSLFNIS